MATGDLLDGFLGGEAHAEAPAPAMVSSEGRGPLRLHVERGDNAWFAGRLIVLAVVLPFLAFALGVGLLVGSTRLARVWDRATIDTAMMAEVTVDGDLFWCQSGCLTLV